MAEFLVINISPALTYPSPRLILAPMEGLADDVLRDVLTRAGKYDWCVTEFIRVSTTVLPNSVFTRTSPELANGSRTRAGTPVRVQLLGSDPAMLAVNAANLARLRPAGIDLNFGCPAPLVNRRGGGAALLDDPELLYRIILAVRAAVPSSISVTAKMRLGIHDSGCALECAQALESGGIDELVIHARTRDDRYRPPARWELLSPIREALRVPVIANGDVWTLADYHAIRQTTGCDDVMLGRGAITDPLLAQKIRANCLGDPDADWLLVADLIDDFWSLVKTKVNPVYASGRLKQWLRMVQRNYPPAKTLFNEIRELRSIQDVSAVLERHQAQASA